MTYSSVVNRGGAKRASSKSSTKRASSKSSPSAGKKVSPKRTSPKAKKKSSGKRTSSKTVSKTRLNESVVNKMLIISMIFQAIVLIVCIVDENSLYQLKRIFEGREKNPNVVMVFISPVIMLIFSLIVLVVKNKLKNHTVLLLLSLLGVCLSITFLIYTIKHKETEGFETEAEKAEKTLADLANAGILADQKQFKALKKAGDKLAVEKQLAVEKTITELKTGQINTELDKINYWDTELNIKNNLLSHLHKTMSDFNVRSHDAIMIMVMNAIMTMHEELPEVVKTKLAEWKVGKNELATLGIKKYDSKAQADLDQIKVYVNEEGDFGKIFTYSPLLKTLVTTSLKAVNNKNSPLFKVYVGAINVIARKVGCLFLSNPQLRTDKDMDEQINTFAETIKNKVRSLTGPVSEDTIMEIVFAALRFTNGAFDEKKDPILIASAIGNDAVDIVIWLQSLNIKSNSQMLMALVSGMSVEDLKSTFTSIPDKLRNIPTNVKKSLSNIRTKVANYANNVKQCLGPNGTQQPTKVGLICKNKLSKEYCDLDSTCLWQDTPTMGNQYAGLCRNKPCNGYNNDKLQCDTQNSCEWQGTPTMRNQNAGLCRNKYTKANINLVSISDDVINLCIANNVNTLICNFVVMVSLLKSMLSVN